MNSSEISQLIREIEAKFPVDTWTVDGLHVWPLVRIKLYFDIFLSHTCQQPRNETSVFFLIKQGLRALRDVGRFLYVFIADRQYLLFSQRADVLFINNGPSFTNIEGTWYDRLCEPLMEALGRHNLTTRLIQAHRDYKTPLHTKALYIQPMLDILSIKSILFGKKQHDTQLPDFAHFVAFLQARSLKINLPSIKNIQKQADRIQSMAGFYRFLLKKWRPRFVMVADFYNVQGMALNLACRQMHIPAVDIQHGVAGDANVAYGGWSKVPSKGYALLPKLFWCWHAKDAEAIRSWSQPFWPWHQPIVGGDLWLQNWLLATPGFTKSYDERISAIKNAHKAHVLVSLQQGLTHVDALAPLLQAIQQAPSDWLWWFRLHPCELDQKENFKKILHQHHIHRYQLEQASMLPLHALLRHMDVHITCSSAVVIEAVQFGVPSVITHEFGADLFQEELEEGWAVTAFDAQAIILAMHTQLARKKTLPKKITQSGGGIEELIALTASFH